jgi:hypothetical protein
VELEGKECFAGSSEAELSKIISVEENQEMLELC